MGRRANDRNHFRLESRFRDTGLRVLLEMHPAVLPREARKRCLAHRPEPIVTVADDEFQAVHAPLDEA